MQNMKLNSELTPLQKFKKQKVMRVIIYGGGALVFYWSATELIEIKQKRDAEADWRKTSVQDNGLKAEGHAIISIDFLKQ